MSSRRNAQKADHSQRLDAQSHATRRDDVHVSLELPHVSHSTAAHLTSGDRLTRPAALEAALCSHTTYLQRPRQTHTNTSPIT